MKFCYAVPAIFFIATAWKGDAALSEIAANGTNTVYCENGTITPFEIYWLGLE